ncbi:RNA polymerase sigma factor [Parahaliea mediterranea]|uniref:Sigma-70 family RNA polymerase sigma factor n=1 Tax=Parahaliea mediterranea TaxID=651086 RepID=A0A939DED2_9GAMM|nr:sigma-70 family RNA polymerase sigma factor [Parahaliea mediterranea]MBN7796618.1 sigma-70 family RNA polymerase sigma factor [Parahaliea mediterranea]
MADKTAITSELQIQRDRRLARCILAGDDRALREFIDNYFPRLYRYANLRLANPADVEDIVQLTLAQAARRLETYRGESTLLTWMIHICRHEIARQLKHRARGEDVTLPFLNDDLLRSIVESMESDGQLSPEQDSSRVELIHLIQFALDQLPERYALALELKYVEGFNSQEIADRLSISDEATQSLLARARRAFREVCGEALRTAL